MNMNSAKKKCLEMTIQEICEIQDEIEDLVTKCGPPMAPSDSVAHNVQEIAGHLLATADKIIDMGRDLNAITSCMVDVADDAQADDGDLDHVPHILAWAGWTGDLTSDILDTADDLICAIQGLIGSSRGEKKARSASATARSLDARRHEGHKEAQKIQTS